jgi:hypothetical protein
VNAIETGGSVQAGKDYLARYGYSDYGHLLDSVSIDSVSQTVDPSYDFDKATACEVVRVFLADFHPDEQVTALLQIAGLEDVPEPVVEEPIEDLSMWARLVQWARGQGFSG